MEDVLGLENKLARSGQYFITALDDPEDSIPVASGGTGFVSTSPLLVLDVASNASLSAIPLELILNQVTSGTGALLQLVIIGDGGTRRNAAGSGTLLTSHGPALGIADPAAVAAISVSAITIASVDPRIIIEGVFAVGEGSPCAVNFNGEAVASPVTGGRSILVYAWTPGGAGTQVRPILRHAEAKR